MSMTNVDTNDRNDNATVVGQMYGGVMFLKTSDRHIMVQFFTKQLNMKVWLEQPNITILLHENLLLGFSQILGEQQSTVILEMQGMYIFVYPSKSQVDAVYNQFSPLLMRLLT